MRAGDVLDGRYRIDAPLAKGGMGAVYRATHLGTDRLVALKVINSDLVSSPVMLERFRREAKAAGRLSHPHVVDVTDFGLCELHGKQVAYLVMEFLHGRTLRDLLKEKKKLDVDLAIAITEQVALAVDAAHKLGIVHRDLKPENIWLEQSGVDKVHAKVLDFGIAKLREELEVAPSQLPPQLQRIDTFDDDIIVVGEVPRGVTLAAGGGRGLTSARAGPAPTSLGLRAADPGNATGQISWRSAHASSSSSDPSALRSGGNRTPGSAGSSGFGSTPASGQLTEVGGILGTPFYMAPEQFRGDVVDERADIYALGVCVYQMLTGDVPHRGNVGQLVLVHADKTPPPPMQGVPRPIETIVLRALTHEPALRPANARLLAAGLKGAAESEAMVRTRALAIPSAEIVASVGTSFIPYLLPLAALVLAAQAETRLWFLAPLVVVVVAACSALMTMAVAAFLRAPPPHPRAGQGAPLAPGSRKKRARAGLRLVLARLGKAPQAMLAVLLGNPMAPAVWVHAPQTSSSKMASLAAPVRGVLRALSLRTWASAVVVTCCIPFAALGRALALDGLQASLQQGTTPSPMTAAVVAAFGVLTAVGPAVIGAILQIPVALTAVELVDNARAIAGEDPQTQLVTKTAGKARTLYGFLPAVAGVVAWVACVSVGFEAAVLRGASETVAVLVDLGANPNPTRTRQPLHDAAFAGKARTVEALLNGGANPDAFDQLDGPNGGATPLLAAITAGSPECVRLLLEHGANPNLTAKFGETPLHAALGRKTAANRTQIVRMLLERGADVRKPGADGRTPFDMALADGDAVIAKLFAGR